MGSKLSDKFSRRRLFRIFDRSDRSDRFNKKEPLPEVEAITGPELTPPATSQNTEGQPERDPTADLEALTGQLRKIVFAYERALPARLVLGAKQLQDKIKAADLSVTVLYCPFSDVPEDTDLILVSESLLETARQKAPQGQVMALKAFVDNPVYELLMARLLEQGGEFKTETLEATAVTSEEKTIRYRGYQKID